LRFFFIENWPIVTLSPRGAKPSRVSHLRPSYSLLVPLFFVMAPAWPDTRLFFAPLVVCAARTRVYFTPFFCSVRIFCRIPVFIVPTNVWSPPALAWKRLLNGRVPITPPFSFPISEVDYPLDAILHRAPVCRASPFPFPTNQHPGFFVSAAFLTRQYPLGRFLTLSLPSDPILFCNYPRHSVLHIRPVR